VVLAVAVGGDIVTPCHVAQVPGGPLPPIPERKWSMRPANHP